MNEPGLAVQFMESMWPPVVVASIVCLFIGGRVGRNRERHRRGLTEEETLRQKRLEWYARNAAIHGQVEEAIEGVEQDLKRIAGKSPAKPRAGGKPPKGVSVGSGAARGSL